MQSKLRINFFIGQAFIWDQKTEALNNKKVCLYVISAYALVLGNGLRLAAGGETEFLLPGTDAKIYNKKFIVTTIAEKSFFSPELLLKDVQMLIISTSAPLAQNRYYMWFRSVCWLSKFNRQL